MRRTAVERQGRQSQEYAHISRVSNEVFRQSGKQKNSRVNWWSNSIDFIYSEAEMTLDERLAGITPHKRQISFQQLEFYAFIHFTVNTFTDR